MFGTFKAIQLKEIAEKKIEKTVEFFHKMGMKTKISENAENMENTADFIVNRFEERVGKPWVKTEYYFGKSKSYCRNELLKLKYEFHELTRIILLQI